MRTILGFFLLCSFVGFSSECSGVEAITVSNDVAEAALLSNGAVFGRVRVVSEAGDAPGLVSGRIEVNDRLSDDVLFENVLENSLRECDGRKCSVFYHTSESGRLLTQFPKPALFLEERAYRSFAAIKKTAQQKVAAVLRKDHCSTEMSDLLHQLDGEDQQAAINSLFSRALSRDDRVCLASQIRSLMKLKKSSFSPPYPSDEGIYHHGFQFRGDLIAFLLPHLTKVNIIPGSFPLSPVEREEMVAAWTYVAATLAD